MTRDLQLADIEISIGNRALVALSVAIGAGQVLTIMGPSGSGKSTLANLAFGLPQACKGRALRQSMIDAALTAVDLQGYGPRDPATLSGGERARVALMRCLLSEPSVLLLDEPFSRLDAGLRQSIRHLVFSHASARELPVILVTHDPADALAAAGPVLSPLGVTLSLTPEQP